MSVFAYNFTPSAYAADQAAIALQVLEDVAKAGIDLSELDLDAVRKGLAAISSTTRDEYQIRDEEVEMVLDFLTSLLALVQQFNAAADALIEADGVDHG